jgi:hypothetical protein
MLSKVAHCNHNVYGRLGVKETKCGFVQQGTAEPFTSLMVRVPADLDREGEFVTDNQIIEELLSSSQFLMAVSFVISLCLCVILLPLHGKQKVYVSVVLSVIIPQLACIFPFYFYIFFLGDDFRPLAGKIFGSFVLISVFVSPQWIGLLILCLVIFARHFRNEERSYLVDALAALVIGGTLAALAIFAAMTGVSVEI